MSDAKSKEVPAAEAAGSAQPHESPQPAPEDKPARPQPEDERAVESQSEEKAPEQSSAEARISSLEAERDQLQDRLLRCQAELENFRKRMQRTMAEERRYAAVPLVSDLLAVVDNLARAVEAAEQAGGGAGLLEGVKMVAQQLDGVLRKHHCEPIQAVGQPFDPHLHEAVGQQPSQEHPAGTVCQQLRVGYQVHDRVIRPAQVFVSTGPPEGPQEPADEASSPPQRAGRDGKPAKKPSEGST